MKNLNLEERLSNDYQEYQEKIKKLDGNLDKTVNDFLSESAKKKAAVHARLAELRKNRV